MPSGSATAYNGCVLLLQVSSPIQCTLMLKEHLDCTAHLRMQLWAATNL